MAKKKIKSEEADIGISGGGGEIGIHWLNPSKIFHFLGWFCFIFNISERNCQIFHPPPPFFGLCPPNSSIYSSRGWHLTTPTALPSDASFTNGSAHSKFRRRRPIKPFPVPGGPFPAPGRISISIESEILAGERRRRQNSQIHNIPRGNGRK